MMRFTHVLCGAGFFAAMFAVSSEAGNEFQSQIVKDSSVAEKTKATLAAGEETEEQSPVYDAASAGTESVVAAGALNAEGDSSAEIQEAGAELPTEPSETAETELQTESQNEAQAAELEAETESGEAQMDDSELAEAESEEAGEDDEFSEPDDSREEELAEIDVQATEEFLDFSDWALPILDPSVVTSPYGLRRYRMHKGIDIRMKRGEPVVSVAAGTIVRSGYERRGYGHYVYVDHGNGVQTRYAHLSKRYAKVGEQVQKGEAIGLAGNTGRSTGPHLHFEIRYGETLIDPNDVFNFEEHYVRRASSQVSVQMAQATYDEIQKELSKHRYYKVRRGDTLSGIAKKFGTSVEKLCRLNKISRNSIIRPGQILQCS